MLYLHCVQIFLDLDLHTETLLCGVWMACWLAMFNMSIHQNTYLIEKGKAKASFKWP